MLKWHAVGAMVQILALSMFAKIFPLVIIPITIIAIQIFANFMDAHKCDTRTEITRNGFKMYLL